MNVTHDRQCPTLPPPAPFTRLAEHLTALRALYTQSLPGRWKPDLLRRGMVRVRG